MTKRRYSVVLTAPFQKGIEELVDRGFFLTPQNAIREGLRCIFKRYGIKPFSYPVKEAS